MDSYNYENDGKFHTRYSDLVRAQSEYGAESLITNPVLAKNKAIDEGLARHTYIESFFKKHRKLPANLRKLGISPIEVEKVMQAEIIPGVVLHSTVDIVVKNGDFYELYDVKTTNQSMVNAMKLYKSSMQLPIYSLQFMKLGHKVKQVGYIIERYEEGKLKETKILKKEIDLRLKAQAIRWIKVSVDNIKKAKKNIIDNGF